MTAVVSKNLTGDIGWPSWASVVGVLSEMSGVFAFTELWLLPNDDKGIPGTKRKKNLQATGSISQVREAGRHPRRCRGSLAGG